jgi:uncharacterized OsmC-like protein
VDLASVGALISQIRENPAAAQSTWKADVRWTGAFRSEVRVRDFEPIKSDEPPILGGSNTAPNPVEQLLGALGNCLAVGYAAHASVAGIALRSVRIALEGDIDLHAFLGLGGGNAGYQSIRVKVDLQCDATAQQLRKLHETVVGTSPVGHTLSRAIPVQIELR